jgi:hypothetical protein
MNSLPPPNPPAPISRDIWLKKYKFRDEASIENTWSRVATKAVASAELRRPEFLGRSVYGTAVRPPVLTGRTNPRQCRDWSKRDFAELLRHGGVGRLHRRFVFGAAGKCDHAAGRRRNRSRLFTDPAGRGGCSSYRQHCEWPGFLHAALGCDVRDHDGRPRSAGGDDGRAAL